MPWIVRNDPEVCSEENPWAVIEEESGESVGCHPSEEAALDQVAALNANVDEEEAAQDGPGRFQIMVIPEGVRTTDGREIAEGALGTRELPIPLMMQTENPEWGGHGGAVLAGRIDELARDARGEWWGIGTYDGGEPGQECRRLVDEQMLRWVSADIEALEVEYLEEGDCSEEGFWEGRCQIIERVLDGRIMGATATPFPAFPTAVIIPEGADREEATADGRAAAESLTPQPALGLAAAAPLLPPAAWFEDPHLDGPTPLTVQSDGRVFGHAALWGTCHTGRPDACTTAPRSPSGYAYYRTGAITTAEGGTVAVGQITMNTGHADLRAGHHVAAAHYDNTGAAVADVSAGEDEYGIWVAGATRPGTTDEQLRALSAASLSGDWRPISGRLELVALLAVNVPGFPVPRGAHSLVAGGQPRSLVAAGLVRTDPVNARLTAMERELRTLRASVAPLRGLAVEQLRQRVSS